MPRRAWKTWAMCAGMAMLVPSTPARAASAEEVSMATDPQGLALAGLYAQARAAADEDDKLRLHRDGIARARARLAATPDDPAGLLWLAAHLGAEALVRGKLVALKVLPEMERLLIRLDETAPGYEAAAASRVLGRLYQKAPAVISIGSSKKARIRYEKALRLAPDHPGNLAFAADFFDDEGERERARALARRCKAVLASGGAWPTHDLEEWRAIVDPLTRGGDR